MSNQEKKTVTVKFTAKEANWLLSKLERIVIECREKIKNGAGGISLAEEKFQAESLQDRIRSEQ